MLTYRPTSEADRARITEWIAADPDHRDKGNPDFFLPNDQSTTFSVTDEKGDVFFVRCESLMRLHIQFAPNEKLRTARAIKEFTPYIAGTAKRLGSVELIYESVSNGLIKFLERLGFKKSPSEHIYDLR